MPTIENLNLQNFSQDNVLWEFELAGDAAAAQAVIFLLNAANISDGDYLCLLPAEQTGELKQVNTGGVSGQNVTFSSNLSLAHKNHERVVKLFGNQIRVYRAADVNGTPPPDSSFNPGSPFATVTIDPTYPYTGYTDNNGGVGYWYKFTYYNPTSGKETDISLAEAVRGGGYGHYVSLEDIMVEAGLNDTRRLDRSQVAVRRDEAESEIKGALAAAGYIMPLQTGAGVLYVPTTVRTIARILTAGFVMLQNFGITKPGNSKNGQAKIDEARQMIAKIQLNDVVLLDSTEQMLAKPSLVDGWPDDTTTDDGVNVGPIVTLDKVF